MYRYDIMIEKMRRYAQFYRGCLVLELTPPWLKPYCTSGTDLTLFVMHRNIFQFTAFKSSCVVFLPAAKSPLGWLWLGWPRHACRSAVAGDRWTDHDIRAVCLHVMCDNLTISTPYKCIPHCVWLLYKLFNGYGYQPVTIHVVGFLVFVQFLKTSPIPNNSDVSPIFGDNIIKGNFHLVSILSISSKLYESIFNDQMLNKFCEAFDALLSAYSCYYRYYSCQTFFAKFVEGVKSDFDRGHMVLEPFYGLIQGIRLSST